MCLFFCQSKPDVRHLRKDGSRLLVVSGARHFQALFRKAPVLYWTGHTRRSPALLQCTRPEFRSPPLANKPPQKRTPTVTARGSCCLSGLGGRGVGGWGCRPSDHITNSAPICFNHERGSSRAANSILIQSPRRRPQASSAKLQAQAALLVSQRLILWRSCGIGPHEPNNLVPRLRRSHVTNSANFAPTL